MELRHLRSAALFLVWPAAVLALILVDGCLGAAHAQAAAPPAATAGLDTMTVLVIVGVVLGGLGSLLGGLSTILHAIAPRDRRQWSLCAAHAVDTLRADVAQLSNLLRTFFPSAPIAPVVNVNSPMPAAAPPPAPPLPAAAVAPPSTSAASSAGMLAVLLAVAALLAGGAMLPACLSSTRSDTLHAALIVHDTTEKAFQEYDGPHQQQIVASATSRAQGETQLKAYQAKAAKVVAALDLTLRAIAALGDVNDQPHIDGVKAALVQLTAAYAELKGDSK